MGGGGGGTCLAWSLAAQQWVDHRVQQALAGTGYQTAPRMVQPMPFSTLLWRATVLHREERLEIVTGLLDGDIPLHIEGFPRDANLVAAAKQLDDGRRLEWFTGSFLDYRLERMFFNGVLQMIVGQILIKLQLQC